MKEARSSGKGLWSETARWQRVVSRKRRISGMTPTVDTVRRDGLQPMPQSEVRTSQQRRMASVLSKGSPMPMKTMLVSWEDSGTESIWFIISAADRLPDQPCLPVMQKRQFMRQPTWHETQRVARSSSGMKTVSTRPCSVSKRYLAVPSCDRADHTGAARPSS